MYNRHRRTGLILFFCGGGGGGGGGGVEHKVHSNTGI